MLKVRTNYSCSCLWLDLCNLIRVSYILKVLGNILQDVILKINERTLNMRLCFPLLKVLEHIFVLEEMKTREME